MEKLYVGVLPGGLAPPPQEIVERSRIYMVTSSVLDPRGTLRRMPLTDQNFLNFMQFFGKISMFAPSHGGLVPPPMGDPGSAPDLRNERSRNIPFDADTTELNLH